MKKALYRGKDADTKEWLYGSYIECDNVMIGKDFGEIMVDPDTVGQFIGITDKDNRELYDGDIVNVEGSKFRAKYYVIWIDAYTTFLLCEDLEPNVNFSNIKYFGNEVKSQHVKYIGNIHDKKL